MDTHVTGSKPSKPQSCSDSRNMPGAGSTRLDEMAALFPGLELFHDLRVSGPDAWPLLAAVTAELAACGARLVSLSARNCDGGQACVTCRLSDLSPVRADDLTRLLTNLETVTSARVEHLLLRARNGGD